MKFVTTNTLALDIDYQIVIVTKIQYLSYNGEDVINSDSHKVVWENLSSWLSKRVTCVTRMKANIRHITRNVNPFGGINFVHAELRRKKMAGLIDSVLGERPKQSKFSYSDILLAWTYCNLCGASRLERANTLKHHLKYIPDFKTPSADQIGRVMKSLATINSNQDTKAGLNHEFNSNETLNNLLLQTNLKFGLIDKKADNIIDIDTTFIFTEKYDSRMTYKQERGYNPAVSLINGNIVNVEMRNGNANPIFRLKETLENVMLKMKENHIKVKRVRIDAGGYQQSLIKYLDKNGYEFFIRCKNSSEMFSQLKGTVKWTPTSVNHVRYEIASINDFESYNREMKYRLVVSRFTENKRKTKNRNSDDYDTYRAIITNNTTLSDIEVFKLYNQRGKEERAFDDLKNNFNWKRMPFSFLNQNTVFLIISAMIKSIYRYLILFFSEKVGFVKKNFRLKKFIDEFLHVSVEWVHTKDRWTLFIMDSLKIYRALSLVRRE